MATPPQLQAQKDLAIVTPQQLFEEALPKTFDIFEEHLAKIPGTFQINIFGEGGGQWFINPSEKSVEAGSHTDANNVLEMGVAEFKDLTTGKLDTAAAMQSGKVRFTGDPDQLVAFGALLGG